MKVTLNKRLYQILRDTRCDPTDLRICEFWRISLSLFRLKNVIVLLPPDYKSKIFRLYVEVKIMPVNNNLVLANKYFVLLTCDILRSFDFIFRDWGKTLSRVLYNACACSYLRVTAKFEKNNKFRVF